MRYATLVLILISGPVYAVPSISSIDGQFVHGATVTLFGSSFGTRGDFNGSSHDIADFLPVMKKDFEDNTLVSDGVTVENSHSQSWSVEGTTAKTNSTKHGKRFFFNHGDGLDRISGLQKTQTGTTGNWFFSFWFWLPSISTLTMVDEGKIFRVYGDSPGNNIYLHTRDDSSSMVIFSECSSCSPAPTSPERAGGWKLGEWQRVDIAMRQNPSEFVVYRNMQKFFAVAQTTTSFTNVVYSFAQQYVYNPWGGNGHTFIYGHMHYSPSDPTPADGGYELFDDLYADYSLAHVELCSDSTWDALATGGGTSDNHCELQIPTAWSNTSISANLNVGSFTAGTTVYAYVVTESGTAESFDVNPTGFSLVVGEAGEGGGEEEEDDEPVSSDGILIGWEATP